MTYLAERQNPLRDERFCNKAAIPKVAYLFVFAGGSADCFIQIASSYIRAIVFLCEPLTRRKPHRSIAFTGRNSHLPARRKRGLSSAFATSSPDRGSMSSNELSRKKTSC